MQTESTSSEKFNVFKSKLEAMVTEQDYVSVSENSEVSEEEENDNADDADL